MRTPFHSHISRLLAIALLCVFTLTAAEHKGQVKFGGLPLPGATVTATQGDRSLVAITDLQGNYSFADLPDGVWTFQVEMLGFGIIKQDVTIASGAGAPEWELKMLPFDEIKASAAPPPPPPPRVSVAPPPETGGVPQNTTQKSPKNKKAAAAAAVPANPQNSFQRAAVNANPNAAPPPAANQSTAEEAVPANSAFANQSASELSQRATDGLAINGSVNNGAASPFAQSMAFGNNRRPQGKDRCPVYADGSFWRQTAPLSIVLSVTLTLNTCF